MEFGRNVLAKYVSIQNSNPDNRALLHLNMPELREIDLRWLGLAGTPGLAGWLRQMGWA